MQHVECGLSFQTFEHVTCSVDGQHGNLDMWSVVWKYERLFADSYNYCAPHSPRLVKAPLDKLNLKSEFTTAVKQE